jgi:putative sterol carrier protein
VVNYGTWQYWQELKQKWDADDRLKNELFKGYTSDIIFRVSDKPNLDQYKGIYLDVKNGAVTKMKVCANRDEKAKVVTEGTYAIWKQIVTQTLDPTKALLTRKLKLAGPMGEVLKYMKGWMRLIELLQEVPTEWEE